MSDLVYKEIDSKNFYEIVKLSKTLPEAQQKCVANNAYSIAEGSVHSNAYYRGIYKEDKPVGFFMIFIPDERSIKEDNEKDFFLWRFMIKYDEQHKHYGKETLDHIVDLGKKLGYKELMTSCEMGEASPYKFYLKYGFKDTGKVAHGEQVLLYKFDK